MRTRSVLRGSPPHTHTGQFGHRTKRELMPAQPPPHLSAHVPVGESTHGTPALQSPQGFGLQARPHNLPDRPHLPDRAWRGDQPVLQLCVGTGWEVLRVIL